MILPSFTIIRLISSLRGLFIAGLKINKNSTMIYTVRTLLMSHGVSLGVCAFRWYGEVVWFLSLHLDIEKITNSPLSVPPFLHLKVLTDRHREAVSRNHFLVLFHTESARCFDLINKLENIQITQVLPHWLKPVLVSRSESNFFITAGHHNTISQCVIRT